VLHNRVSGPHCLNMCVRKQSAVAVYLQLLAHCSNNCWHAFLCGLSMVWLCPNCVALCLPLHFAGAHAQLQVHH
jgi:hypothetical protein